MLDDGTTLTVERHVDIEESNSLSGDAYNAVERGAYISFTGKNATLPKWSVPLTALVLYRGQTSGEWVIVATCSSCDVLYEYGPPRYLFEPGRPRTSYIEFRVRGSRWVRVPLSRESIGRQTNLLFDYKQLDSKQVTAKMRQTLDGNPDIVSEYRVVRIDSKSGHCTPTTISRWIWEAEDRILTALDEKQASADERKRAVELIGGTTFPMTWFSGDIPPEFRADAYPETVQHLVTSYSGRSHVSNDGQLLFTKSERYNPQRERELFWDLYSNRMKAAGLVRFVN